MRRLTTLFPSKFLKKHAEDCNCGAWNGGDRVELPCWPCYRDGFDVPNPSAGEE